MASVLRDDLSCLFVNIIYKELQNPETTHHGHDVHSGLGITAKGIQKHW